MAKFDFITNPNAQRTAEADNINNQYFTVDTADLITVHQWLDYNRYIVTHAILDDKVVGFFNIIPITEECGELFNRQAIKEEDLDISHMLPPQSFSEAKYAYLAAIAVQEKDRYIGKQCAAALLSVICSQLLHGYSQKNFKRIFANPTTFWGNNLIRKLGFDPLWSLKKPLRAGNDIYVLDMKDETRQKLAYFEKRYSKFVAGNPWPELGRTGIK